MLASEISPCPVITFVLNFSEHKWSTNKTILECLDMNERIKPFVSDYRINVIDVAYLSRETINKFKSDFKIIADYFVQMRKTGEYKPMTDEVKHIWELLLLMGKLTDDDRFKVEYYRDHREERMNMCEWLDKVEAKNKREAAIKSALKLLKLGKLTPKEIADSVDLPLEDVVTLEKQLLSPTI